MFKSSKNKDKYIYTKKKKLLKGAYIFLVVHSYSLICVFFLDLCAMLNIRVLI